MQNDKIIPSTLREVIQNLKVILIARAGAGKTETLKEVMKRLNKEGVPAWELLTGTTRPPRDGEKHGVDYMFFSEEEFQNEDFIAKILLGEELSFGVMYKENIREGIGFFSPISLQYATDTASSFIERDPDTEIVFIVLDIDKDVRIERMRNRGEEEHRIQARLAVEDREGPYDLSRLPDDVVVLKDATLSIEEVAEKIIESIEVRERMADLDKSVKPLSV